MGRFLKFCIKFIIAFIGLSLLLVVIFKFVPVPVTATMVMDDKKITKQWEPLANIDRNMVRAAIAAEDGKFCAHNGFDTQAIEQAMQRNRQIRANGGGTIRGGSTISQQTAKNVFLWQGGGYIRKGFEAWFTFLIENIWGKRRIIEVYLNVAETGISTYGAEAAAQRYYSKSAASLSPIQSARIAAVLPLPKRRPVINPTGFTRSYGNKIAARMAVVRRDALDGCVYE